MRGCRTVTGGTYARELRGCHPAPPPPPPRRHELTPRGAPQRHELAPEAAAEAGGKLQGRRLRLRHPRQRGERKRNQALRPAVRPEAGRRSSTPDRCAYPRGRLQDHPHNPVQLRKFRLDLRVLELARCCVAAPPQGCSESLALGATLQKQNPLSFREDALAFVGWGLITVWLFSSNHSGISVLHRR